MYTIQDLDIEEKIVPLFDYTITEKGHQTLKKLFSVIPNTLEEVLQRQEIFKALHTHWDVLEDFNFKVIDCREAYEYCSNLHHQDLQKSPNLLVHILTYKTKQIEIASKRSKLIQLLLLFEHLTTKYFSRLITSKLPIELQQGVNLFKSLYEKSAMATFLLLLRQDKFSNKHVLLLEKRLHQYGQGDLNQAWEFLFLFEAYFSMAKGMKKLDLVFPIFDSEHFKLEDFYHPFLKEPVKNSVTLTGLDNVMLLTGPNMSGKSTFFKSIALCVYLAHIGAAVPATYCSLPYFSCITISIHAKDDLTNGYSHFMHELRTVKEVILKSKESPTFAVFDELFKGTNPEDAKDLLLNTISGLTQFKGSFFLVSSHVINHLDLGGPAKGGVQPFFLDCQVQEEIPTFSYQLRPGSSQLKIGRILFDQLGLNDLLQENGTNLNRL
ncbi:MutS-related protein [Nibribacter koreensis]|uniref:MutS family DNA mismatch repair protein n=1 Tax=Nibribacter koreensis TaxID=1084519 RepID=A0ABP8F8H1_9BACT